MPTAAILQQEMIWSGGAVSSISASINGRASELSTLTGSGILAGIVLGHTTETALLKASGSLTGAILGKTADSGTLNGIGTLSGIILGKTSDSGIVTGTGILNGVILGHTSDLGVLKGAGLLTGSVIGHTSDSGLLLGSGALVGSIIGFTSDIGTLKGAGRLNGVSVGIATVSVVTTTGQFANISGQSLVSGIISGSGIVFSSILGQTSVQLQNGSIPPSLHYSVPDCRMAPFGPNLSRDVQDTLIFDVQTSSNSDIPRTDSRVKVFEDSRDSGIPLNSRSLKILESND